MTRGEFSNISQIHRVYFHHCHDMFFMYVPIIVARLTQEARKEDSPIKGTPFSCSSTMTTTHLSLTHLSTSVNQDTSHVWEAALTAS